MPPPDGRRRVRSAGPLHALRLEVSALREALVELVAMLRGGAVASAPPPRAARAAVGKPSKVRVAKAAHGGGGGGARPKDGGQVASTSAAAGGVLGMFSSQDLADAAQPGGGNRPVQPPSAATSSSIPSCWNMVTRKKSGSKGQPSPKAGEGAAARGAPAGRSEPRSAGQPGARTLPSSGAGLQPTAAPLETAPRFALVQEGWSAPVLQSAAALQAGGSGVALATVAEATATKAQMRGAAGALAVVLARPMEGAQPLSACILRDGKEVVGQCYLLQLGTESVTYSPPGAQLAGPGARATTVVMALTVAKQHAEPQVWEAAEKHPILVFRDWLRHQGASVKDAWHAQREGGGNNARISALIRVPVSEEKKILRASGANSVFTRRLGRFTTEVVWLESKTTRSEAWGIAQRHQGALGLVLGSPGLGIRCQPEDAFHLTKVLLGKEAALKKESTLWEVTGLPLEADVASAMETLTNRWPWQAQLVKAMPRGGMRVLVVRAIQQPPDTRVTVGRWLLAVCPACRKQPHSQDTVTFKWQKPANAGIKSVALWSERPGEEEAESKVVGEEAVQVPQQPPSQVAPTYRDTEDLAYELALHVEYARNRGLQTAAAFLDLAKAYEKVDISLLAAACETVGMPKSIFGPALSMYSAPRRVKVGGACSHTVIPRCGLPAGCPLAVQMLGIFLAPVLQKIDEAHLPPRVRVFVDDIALWGHGPGCSPVKPVADAVAEIQQYCDDTGLQLNKSKCQLMATRRDTAGALAKVPQLHGFHSAMVVKDLGVDQQWRGQRSQPAAVKRRQAAAQIAAQVRRLPWPVPKKAILLQSTVLAKALWACSINPPPVFARHALRLQIMNALYGTRRGVRSSAIALNLHVPGNTLDPVVIVPTMVLMGYIKRLRRNTVPLELLCEIWPKTPAAGDSYRRKHRCALSSVTAEAARIGWQATQPEKWISPQGILVDLVLVSWSWLKQSILDSAMQAALTKESSRRKEFAGIETGVDVVALRAQFKALRDEPGETTHKRQGAARVIQQGGVWTSARAWKLGESPCSWCAGPPETVVHRWWECPAWATIRTKRPEPLLPDVHQRGHVVTKNVQYPPEGPGALAQPGPRQREQTDG